MISEALTIVIPTRDRPALLELCLRSIFDRQTRLPRVVVSDNSTKEASTIRELKQRYDFDYVRQSGELSAAEHQNLCFTLPRTKWMMLLHDDDELQPDALAQLESVLSTTDNAAVVVGGLDYIDESGNKIDAWMPAGCETLRGDEAVPASRSRLPSAVS